MANDSLRIGISDEICMLRRQACRARIEPKIELVLERLEQLNQRVKAINNSLLWLQRLLASGLLGAFISFVVKMAINID